MTLFETLKFVHVLSAIIWVGGSILGIVIMLRVRTADPVHRVGFYRDMAFIGERVIGSASLVVLIAGIWMVFERPAFAFGDTWILIGLIGIVISGAVGGAYLGPKVKKVAEKLEKGENADSFIATINRVVIVDMVLLLVIVWAMIAKPGL